MWFLIPLIDYLGSPFYRSSWTRVVLGVCISAALPLSWHLAFVAIPVSAPILGPLVGPWRKRQDLARYHKFVAWSTLGWAGIHAGGELIYLLFDTSSSSFLEVINLSKGENLLFVAGLATALALIVHAVIAGFRRQCFCRHFDTFRSVHRALAAVVLVFATTHWWPFVFFLAPTVATHAASAATRVCVSTGRKTLSRQTAARMLAASLVCNLLVMVGLWQVRQWYMQMLQPRVMYYLAFMFPPLTLVVGFIGAWAGSLLTKILCRGDRKSLGAKDVDIEEERQRPLLRGDGVE